MRTFFFRVGMIVYRVRLKLGRTNVSGVMANLQVSLATMTKWDRTSGYIQVSMLCTCMLCTLKCVELSRAHMYVVLLYISSVYGLYSCSGIPLLLTPPPSYLIPVPDSLQGGYGASDSTKDWYDEVSDYTYSSNSCSKVCGHYTQVCR